MFGDIAPKMRGANNNFVFSIIGTTNEITVSGTYPTYILSFPSILHTANSTVLDDGSSNMTIGSNLTVTGLNASEPVLTNGSKQLVSGQINLASSSYVTGLLPLANGGTNANLTASNGGIVYSTASAFSILSGTTTANQLLISGSSTTPAWTTSTYPSTNAVNTLLYASSANVMAALATANNGVLITSGTGVPSISSTLPTAVQTNITELGTITVGVWNGTIVTGTYGGTGINNGASTITIGGSHTLSGAYTSTFTFTNTTSVTFPTSGTLATTSGVIIATYQDSFCYSRFGGI